MYIDVKLLYKPSSLYIFIEVFFQQSINYLPVLSTKFKEQNLCVHIYKIFVVDLYGTNLGKGDESIINHFAVEANLLF